MLSKKDIEELATGAVKRWRCWKISGMNIRYMRVMRSIILRLSVGTDYSGKIANLYYYNETTGKFEYYQAVQVKEDGTVDFKFSHASDYVIVLNDTDMSQTTGSVIASPKTSDNTPIAAAVILLLFGCALMGTAYRKNKHF